MKRLIRICFLFFLLFLLPVLLGCRSTAPKADGGADSAALPLSDYLAARLHETAEVIDLHAYRPTEEEIANTLAHLLAEEPDFFFVSPTYTLSFDPSDRQTEPKRSPVSLTPSYRFTGDALREARADFASRVRAYAAPAKTYRSPLARVAYLHDRMVLDFSYDPGAHVSDPYTLLREGRGVCQAYSLLFLALAREVEVPAACVTCFSHTHAWNQVQIGTDWYHLDLTWDETLLPYPGRVPHTYFLLTDEELATRRAAADETWAGVRWDAPHAANGTSLLSWELADSYGAFATVDGETLYYAVDDRVLALSAASGTIREVYRVEDSPVDACLMTLVTLGGRIYCNLPNALLCITPLVPSSSPADADRPAGALSDADVPLLSGGSPRETCTLSCPLSDDRLFYCGLSLSPAGLLLLSTLALFDAPA